jgi:hypothetical protein
MTAARNASDRKDAFVIEPNRRLALLSAVDVDTMAEPNAAPLTYL